MFRLSLEFLLWTNQAAFSNLLCRDLSLTTIIERCWIIQFYFLKMDSKLSMKEAMINIITDVSWRLPFVSAQNTDNSISLDKPVTSIPSIKRPLNQTPLTNSLIFFSLSILLPNANNQATFTQMQRTQTWKMIRNQENTKQTPKSMNVTTAPVVSRQRPKYILISFYHFSTCLCFWRSIRRGYHNTNQLGVCNSVVGWRRTQTASQMDQSKAVFFGRNSGFL